MSSESPGIATTQLNRRAADDPSRPAHYRRLEDAEERLLLLNKLILYINEVENAPEAMSVMLRTVCEETGWPFGQIWQPKGDVLVCGSVWHNQRAALNGFRKASETASIPRGALLPGSAWQSRQPVWESIVDISMESERVTRAREAGLKAAIEIPVVAGQDLVCVLEFVVFDPRPQDPLYMELISTIAPPLGWIIRQKETSQALKESVERFTLAIQGSTDGLWDAKITPGTLWYDPDAPVYYSPRFKQLLGYDDHEMPNILGSWDSKLHPDDRDRVFDSVRRHLENRVPYDTEYRLQTKSGDYRWFNARGQAVWDEFGMPIRMSGSLRDITPQRHAQEALRWRDRAIAASSCSIIMTDARVPHNPIVYVNPAFERMFGYTAAEAVGQNPRFLQQTDRDQPALIGLREAIAAARPHQTVLRNYRKDHRVIINEVFVAPVHDEHGRLTHFIGIQNDITDRVAAESELQQRESRFRSLIENISDMIIIVDKGGLVQYASPSIERILGYAPADLIGQSVFKGISPNERPALILAAEDLMHRSGALLTRELRYRHREGGWRILEIVAQNHLERPAVNGVIVNARDVTERKKLESIVFQSEKMSAVGQLAAGIAHELNNPLHTILGFADGLAEQTPEDGHFKVPLQFIRHETIRCRSLVQRLLTFSRQPTPGVEMEDVQELVEEVLALIEAQAKIKNVRLERSYADPLPAVSLQRGQIQQMLLNICNNALDAMPDGGLLKVALDVGHNPFGGASDFLRITIADSGPGIPAKIRSRIFEPFFTTKPAGEGTGLGLSLAYEIAKAHHGDIAVSSESGHGTIFEVYLPLLPASERIAV